MRRALSLALGPLLADYSAGPGTVPDAVPVLGELSGLH